MLDAAAAVFVSSGVDAPVREIAARAGVGMGTLYRHFPTRADLIVAVYRHQIEVCADAGPRLLDEVRDAGAALSEWIRLFVELLVTKHGLADALRGDRAESDALHAYFVDRLVPICHLLLVAAVGRHPNDATAVSAYSLLKGVGNLCIGAASDSGYQAEGLVQALVDGVLARSSA